MSKGFVIGLGAVANAGKSELAEQFVELGTEYMHIGSMVRSAAEDNGFIPADSSREAYLPFWEQHAATHGENWISEIAFKCAHDVGGPVLLDGVRILTDAQEIADRHNGCMVWLEGNLDTIARRAVLRARDDDAGLTEQEFKLKMQRDLDGEGGFSMGAIRAASEVYLLPTPQIEDITERAAYNNALARHVMNICGFNQETK